MMQVKIFFWGLVVLMPMGVFGQGSRTSTVLFDKDKFFLKEEAKSKLDSLATSLVGKDILSIQLMGHTDSDAGEAYNVLLSEKRVETVRVYLSGKGLDLSSALIDFKGEMNPVASNENEEGMEKNRRVDVLVTFAPPAEIVVVPEPVKDCTKDTLIRLPKGSLVKINVCDFEKNPDCIKINEIMNPSDARSAGLETIDDEGNLLISGGMFEYDICEGVEVVVYAESSRDCFSGSMDLWTLNDAGTWTKVSPEPLSTVDIGGVYYYPVRLSGVGLCNLDQRAPRERLIKVKFKAEKGIQLDQVILSCDCAFWRANGVPLGANKRKVKLTILCCPSTEVEIYAKTDNQDSLKFEVKPLSCLKGGVRKNKCASRRTLNEIIKKIPKTGYRKYKIRKDDFEPSQGN
jgi:hypothetical protein